MADPQFIRLATKPTAQISYNFQPSVSTAKPALLVFLNGLGLPQVAWLQTIAQLKTLRNNANIPAILTYDRFGQGQTTDRDPKDEGAADPTHGHDCLEVVHDLHQLISQIIVEKLDVSSSSDVTLVLVGNSIGCALARLYAQEYPGTVAGLLLLDSVLANSDFVSIFPDPDAEGFDATTLPEGITAEALRQSREGVRRIFHPSVGSKEGLSRKNLEQLLPASDGPILQGPGGHGPYVTVVGHDFETFAEEAAKMGRPKVLTTTYANPYWHRYNEGLAKITESERSKGPVQAPNSGHFVQKDNPEFVAQELNEILSKIL
jgi:pimeloyl-ACP methyl ester carboxylesterase